jgi:hypothetical protein
MPTPTLAAKIGRYQTRLNRIADILASHSVMEPIPGKPGQTVERIIWTGLLYKSDGKTIDTIQEWEASGAFKNQRGVSHPNDLALYMRDLTDAEIEAGLALLPESAKPAAAASAAAAAIEEAKPEEKPVVEEKPDPVKDPRIADKLAEITWNVYQELIGHAVSIRILPSDIVITTIRGDWAGLIASTLVSYLDSPDAKPVTRADFQPPASSFSSSWVSTLWEAIRPATTEAAGEAASEEVKPPADEAEKPAE